MKSKQIQEFKETEMGKIPSDWEVKKIHELYEIRSGLSKPREEFGFGYPFLTFKEIFENYSVPDELPHLVNSTEKERETGSIKRGDVFLTRTSETWKELGMSSVALKNYDDATFNGFAKRLRPIDDNIILPEFAMYLFRSVKVQDQFLKYNSLTTRASLNGEAIKQVILAIPSSLEQKKISNILLSLDYQIKKIQTQNKILEQIAQAIFKSWFIDFDGIAEFDDSELGEIPKGWRVKKLADVCIPQYGYTESANNEPVGPKFLRITDMNKDPWINWTTVPYCTITDSNLEKYSLKQGDVVVSRMADPGKAGIIEEAIESVFASYLIRLKTSSMEHSYFLFYFLRSKRFLDYVQGAAGGGSVQKNMNAQVIINIEFIEPPTQLVKSFFKFVYPIRMTIVNNLHQIKKLKEICDLLLVKFMSGEIRV